jgi:cell division inhibitor SulA
MNTIYNSHQLSQRNASNAMTSKIVDVAIPRFTNVNAIIFPIIASQSLQSSTEWTTWITHRTPTKAGLAELGADLTRLRIVHVSKETDVRWMVWQALALGNSHTVIAEQTAWPNSDMMDMERAAQQGQTRAILMSLK